MIRHFHQISLSQRGLLHPVVSPGDDQVVDKGDGVVPGFLGELLGCLRILGALAGRTGVFQCPAGLYAGFFSLRFSLVSPGLRRI